MFRMTHRLLYLCTGNYYRSRFAELLFNVEARRRKLSWLAESRGIALDRGVDNVGPISAHAVRGLQARRIAVDPAIRFPLQVQVRDLVQADLIIAIDEAEHRPLLSQRFSDWADAVEYWHVPDLGGAAPDDALSALEQEITALIPRLES
jgi:protein-tyrosine phosphatase